MKLLTIVCAGLVCAGPVFSQSINIDFGATGNVPSASYGGAGAVGVWNEFGNLPTAQEFPLLGLDGESVAGVIYMIGPDDVLDSDDPAITGNDGYLMDDMLIGYNDPIDVCIFFKFLENGRYEITTYGLTPNDPSREHRLRVDYADEGPVFTGGAWPGQHVEGVTFARHHVDVTDGRIGLHSGEIELFDVSGINGVQLRLIEPAAVGDLERAASGSFLFGVYPNPAFAEQRIELRLEDARPHNVEIIDVSGRLVWRETLAGMGAGLRTIVWDGTNIRGRMVAPAVYFVRLSTEERPGRWVRLVRTR